MKTKLTLFVAVIGVALFGTGCASTQTDNVKTYQLKNLKSDDLGILRSQNDQLPVTGRVVEYFNGAVLREFHVKNGIKHGTERLWHKGGNSVDSRHLGDHSVFDNGKIVWHKSFATESRAGMWKGSKIYQMKLPGWNEDGTPAERGKEKAIEK